jgi:ABC-type branched-subunit amino acid transport system permease subunit
LRWIGSTTTLATEIAIYALYALGFNLLLGYAGLVSFGASAFFGAASCAAGIAVLHLFDNMYFSILFGTVTAGVLGLVIGLLILRRRGIYFSLLTLAFTQLFYEIAFKWTDLTGGENGLQGISRSTLTSPLAIIISSLASYYAACTRSGASSIPRSDACFRRFATMNSAFAALATTPSASS